MRKNSELPWWGSLSHALFVVLTLSALAAAQAPIRMEGRLHLIHGDGQPGSDDHRHEFVLIDEAEHWTSVEIDHNTTDELGGAQALSGKRVVLLGEYENELSQAIPSQNRLRVVALRVLQDANDASGPGGAAPELGPPQSIDPPGPNGLNAEGVRLDQKFFGGSPPGPDELVELDGKELLAEERGSLDANASVLSAAPHAAGADLPSSTDLAAAALTGSQRWVTLLCRFGDMTGTTSDPTSYFIPYLSPGTSFPGMDHYWRQVSYNNVNLNGSIVLPWRNLPQPKSYYVPGGSADLGRIATDCTGIHDPFVYFPNFDGINLVVNDTMGCCAWGGGFSMTRDGVNKSYSATWMPPWGYRAHGVMVQEMGHGFGLPHSSGPYSATYDSRWDPMSNGFGNCAIGEFHPDYNCLAVHTIAYHKDKLGWIPPAQKFTATPGSTQTINLERLALPSNANDRLLKVHIWGQAKKFYTLEARKRVGYDGYLGGFGSKVPGESVLIHKVDTTLGDRQARVVDDTVDNNPNDVGAQWVPGESYDALTTDGIKLEVIADLGTGYRVRVESESIAEITSLWPVPSRGPGEMVRFWARVRNNGVAPLPSGARVWFSVPGFGWVGSAPVDGVAPGGSLWRFVDWRIPASVSPGSLSYSARVWKGSADADWIAGWYGAWKGPQNFTVSYPTTITSLWPVYDSSGGLVHQGDSARLWARVRNDRSTPIATGSSVWRWTSATSGWVCSNNISGQAGGSQTWYLCNWTVPGSVPNGNYSYYARTWLFISGEGWFPQSAWSSPQNFTIY